MRRQEKKKTAIYFLLVALLCWAFTYAIFSQEDNNDEARSIKAFALTESDAPNPHLDFDCTECHDRTPDRQVDTGKTVGFTEGDIINTCRSCHDRSANLHPAGIVPTMKTPEYLPLDSLGQITCGTCHNLHLRTVGNYLLRGFTDEVEKRYDYHTDLCFDCHGEKFSEKNPHRMQLEKQTCHFCHSSKPTETDTAETVKFRKDVIAICSFCHNDVRQKNHPLNVDSSIKVPEELPRSAEGEIFCGTCHNPHGTTETIHFLREEYIVSLESEKYVMPHYEKDGCTACHITRPLPGDTIETVNFRYNGNYIAICNSCHGLNADVHPVNIKPPPTMTVPPDLPLSEDGKLTCVTCHAPQGEKPGKKLMRGEYKNRNDLCFRCHDREDFAQMNPHVEQEEKRKCMTCHITPPDRTIDDHVSVRNNIKGSIVFLCIRCHPEKPHPSGASHLIRPTMIVSKDFPLSEEETIVCTTCHNPHLNPSKVSKLLRKGFNCSACHVL